MSSFVHQLPLKIAPKDERILNIRFEKARFLYNAILSEGLKRLSLIKQSKIYTKAKSLSKSKEKTKLFRQAFKKYKLSDYELQKFGIEVKNSCDIYLHLDTHSSQKIATRAYKAIIEYAYNKRGKPRFKSKNRLNSVESKQHDAGIRYKGHYIAWKGLQLSIIFDLKDKHGLQSHALSSVNKYCRIIRKKIKNKNRYFVQLIQEGSPFLKKPFAREIVGLDIGPSTLAVCGKNKALLTAFCKELKPHIQEIRLLQRKMDRSFRSMNKDNYDEKGCVKKGMLNWIKSSRYLKMQNKLSDGFRKLKEYRKRLHGKLVNEILSFGNIIRTEKLSYRGWQKKFGRSIGFRAPSMFLSILSRKAVNAGGCLEEFSTKKTRLSQFCHNCRTYQKKPLSQRWHHCNCNIKQTQRDLYSSFLSKHVKNNNLDISQVEKDWPGVYPLLEQAMSRLNQTAKGKLRFSSFGLGLR